MRKSIGNSCRGRACVIALILLASMVPGISNAAADETDYVLSPLPRAAPAQSATRAMSKFQFMFGAPAKWPGVLHWSYNPANAPAPYSGDDSGVVQRLNTESAKWTAGCGIQIVYDGETTTAPRTLIAGGPDGINVIGWHAPDIGISADTFDFYQNDGSGTLTLVDTDMQLSPVYVNNDAQFTRTVVHEWGHAIGLGHSNLERTLMSGPPESTYTNYTDLTADDVHGCRCLYGPPAGQQTGDLCSLPLLIDFAFVNVGATTVERQITVTNNGTATMTMGGIATATPEFLVGTSSCQLGIQLAPGASCAFGVLAHPSSLGVRTDEVTIDTSEGPYRVPLTARGINPLPAFAANFEGIWSNAPAGSESGWGINLSHQGDAIFASWFTYDATGKAWWLSMTATRTGDNAFAGTLFETRGPAFNSVPFNTSAVTYSAVGSASLTFSDANNGLFAYTVKGVSQTKHIAGVVFGPPPVCTFGALLDLSQATNYQGMWWASGAGEGGWGINFTHQGDVIFASWFTYDFDGAPLWLSATATLVSPGIYTGALYRTNGPAFSAVPFNSANVGYTPVGNLLLTFANGNSATFAYSVTLGNPPVTVTQSKQLTRFVFNPPGTVCEQP